MAKGGKNEDMDLGFHNLEDDYSAIIIQYLK